MTPLHYGLKTKNITIVEHLLQYCHSNPNICDKVSSCILACNDLAYISF